MKMPDDVTHILNILEKNGYSAYIVGGCVRDSIMNTEPKDWDIAASARPEEVKELFPKTYDTGIKHGTVTLVLNNKSYEITTYRIDGEYKDYRHPESILYSDNIWDDLKRRDFTINAIACNVAGDVEDPFDGVKDINEKLIRGVGDPNERFSEDALRMLRALRFAAKLGFSIEEQTSKAIMKNAALIKNISAERIREELFELITAPYLDVVLSNEFFAVIEQISPALAKSIQSNKDSIKQLLRYCKNVPRHRMAALICYMDDSSADGFLKMLKLSNAEYTGLTKLHRIKNLKIGANHYDVVKKINQWGTETFEDYLYFQMLTCVAKETSLTNVLKIEECYKCIVDNKLPVFVKDLAVNGYDLKNEFSISGNIIGATLNHLLDFVHLHPTKNNFNTLLKEAYTFITGAPVKD